MAIFNSKLLVYQRLSLSFLFFDQQKKGLPRKKSSNAGPAGHNTTSPPHDISDKSSGDDGLEFPPAIVP